MAISSPTDTSYEQPRLRLWTREEYHRAAELGLIRPDEKLELIEGEIIQKVSPQNTPHTTSVRLTAKELESAFGPNHEVRYQMPLVASDISEPEPDILVLKGTTRDYEERQPATEDTLLVVEVSDSTLAFDRRRKARMYARAGVLEYWIVNLVQRQIEVHREPQSDGTYASVTTFGETESVAPLGAPGKAISIVDLLPTKR